jgi:hypothetical protein
MRAPPTEVPRFPRGIAFCYHPRVRPSLLAALLLGSAACGSRARTSDSDFTPIPASDLGAVAARVGQVPIYGKQILAEAKRSGKPPREALDALITVQLLAERARRDGWRPPGATDADVKSTLVQRLLERDLDPDLRVDAVPDSVIRPLYERAKDSFVHPRLVDAGILAIYTGALMKPEPKAARARAAHELAAYLKQHPPKSLADFIAVAHDPVWSARAVVYRRFLQSEDQPLSAKVGAEIVKLGAPGETTPLLSDEDGFFVARYIGERPPQNISFEQARDRLRAGYLERWQRQRFEAFTTKLWRAHKVEAFFDRIPTNEQGP